MEMLMSGSVVRVLAAPLVVLLAACATETVGPAAISPIAEVRAAGAAVVDAATGRWEVTVTIGDAREEVTMYGTGAFDSRTGRSSLSLDLSGLAALAGGGDALIPELAATAFEVIVVDDVTYLRSPLLAAFNGDGGWWSVESADLGGLAGAGGLPAEGLVNPQQLLDLAQAVGEVAVEGQESVRGVLTTRYRVALPPYAEFSSGEARLDLWIDDEGLPRRLAITEVGAAAEAQVSIVLELFDYGEPVSISPPPPEDVTPLGAGWGRPS